MKFIDLCSGIGAAHLAFKKLSCQCVGYAEIDKKAEKTYKLFFGSELKNYGDLMKIKSSDLPSFDILLAGFPCQSFSVVGQRKGFIDERGQIIFGIKNILKEKKPKFFLLENVKGILSAGNGDVINVIVKGLEAQGYNVYCKTLNSYNYGTPQIRERVYFVGIRNDLTQKFKFPDNDNNIGYNIQRFLINNDDKHILSGKPFETFKNKYLNNKYNFGKYNFDDLIKSEYLVIDTRQSDLRLYIDKVPTIRTGRQGIIYVKNGKLRKLSAMEALRLQGFDEDMSINADSAFSQTALLSQAGNAMTVNVMHDLGKIILESYT